MAKTERLIMDTMLDDVMLVDDDTTKKTTPNLKLDDVRLVGKNLNVIPEGIVTDREGNVVSHGGYTNSPEYGPQTIDEAFNLSKTENRLTMNEDNMARKKSETLKLAKNLDEPDFMFGYYGKKLDQANEAIYDFLDPYVKVVGPGPISHGLLSEEHGIASHLDDAVMSVAKPIHSKLDNLYVAAKDFYHNAGDYDINISVGDTGYTLSTDNIVDAMYKGYENRYNVSQLKEGEPIKMYLTNPISKKKIEGSDFEIPNTWYGRMFSDFTSWLDY